MTRVVAQSDRIEQLIVHSHEDGSLFNVVEGGNFIHHLASNIA